MNSFGLFACTVTGPVMLIGAPVAGPPVAGLYCWAKRCAFNPRCRMAQDICRRDRPELREVRPGRYSACHFAEEVVDA